MIVVPGVVRHPVYAECRESHFVLDKMNCMPYSFLRVKSPQGGFSKNKKLECSNSRKGKNMSFFENTRKPIGLGGKIMVSMMNIGHRPVAKWGLQFLNLAPDANVLDCGCGGGANIRKLLKRCLEGSASVRF